MSATRKCVKMILGASVGASVSELGEVSAYRIVYVNALSVVRAHDLPALWADQLHTILILVVGVGPLRRQVVLAPVCVVPRSPRAYAALLTRGKHRITSEPGVRTVQKWSNLTCSGGPHVTLSEGPLHGKSTYARHFSLRTWQKVSPTLQRIRARLHRHLFPSFLCSFVGPLHGFPCVSFRM